MTTSTSIDHELAAIRTSAAIFPLTTRAFLRITGADATRWLNGMVTNNIAALAPGEGNYNFLLNAQGRIQGDCTIFRELGDPATYLLETDASQLETIQTHLDKFIIMDDVEINPVEDHLSLLLVGNQALYFLSAIDLISEDLDPTKLAKITWHDRPLVLTRIHSPLVPMYEIWSDPGSLAAVTDALLVSDIHTISESALEKLRILTAIPKFGLDITEKILPQETAQTHALHFSKGCYLGQEIVERIHSRGQVHRIFTQFTLTGDLPTLPAPLESNGKPAGELTSAALIDGTLYALGYARRELLETNQPLTYPGGTATPSRFTLEAKS